MSARGRRGPGPEPAQAGPSLLGWALLVIAAAPPTVPRAAAAPYNPGTAPTVVQPKPPVRPWWEQ